MDRLERVEAAQVGKRRTMIAVDGATKEEVLAGFKKGQPEAYAGKNVDDFDWLIIDTGIKRSAAL